MLYQQNFDDQTHNQTVSGWVETRQMDEFKISNLFSVSSPNSAKLSSNGFAVCKNFTWTDEQLLFKFYKTSGSADTVFSTNGQEANPFDGSPNEWNYISALKLSVSTGTIHVWNGGFWQDTTIVWTPDVWYELKITHNNILGLFSAWLNGSPIVIDYSMGVFSSEQKMFAIETDYGTSVIYIDNFLIGQIILPQTLKDIRITNARMI